MHNFNLFHHDQAPSGLELPFKWKKGEGEVCAGDLSFEGARLAAYDGERWQHLDLSQTLNSIKPAPKGISGEPLAKALGLIKNPPKRVIDASCGSAKDSLQIWRWGIEVVAYERHPLVYALLWDALRHHPLPNFRLIHGDAGQEHFAFDEHIMFDPMFENTDKKKSLPRKEMQLFKNVVGADQDQQESLSAMLKSGAGRVVIKRPARALATPKPNHSFSGKTIRYDVYLKAP